MRKTVFVFALALLCPPAFAGTLANVSMPDSITVGSQTLVLNGMGVRSKLMIKVYVGGLYLVSKSSDASAIMQSDAAKRMVMHFVYSEVSRDQMAESFSDGFKANAADKIASIKSQIDQFIGALEPMKKGTELVVTYVPSTGTLLTIGGKDKLTIPGLAFAQAVFAVWLGPKPPTNDLKSGLLGKK